MGSSLCACSPFTSGGRECGTKDCGGKITQNDRQKSPKRVPPQALGWAPPTRAPAHPSPRHLWDGNPSLVGMHQPQRTVTDPTATSAGPSDSGRTKIRDARGHSLSWGLLHSCLEFQMRQDAHVS